MESVGSDELFFFANVLIAQGQHELAIKYVRMSVKQNAKLTKDEQTQLFSAYRGTCDHLRRTIENVKNVYNIPGEITESQAQSLHFLRVDLAGRLVEYCNEICTLLNEDLIPNALSAEDQAKYQLAIGDFMRYAAAVGDSSNEYENISQEAYIAALGIAEKELTPAHPIKVAAGLNYSILLNDILDLPGDALKLAQDVYNEASEVVGQIDDETTQKDTHRILKVLKENIISWMENQ